MKMKFSLFFMLLLTLVSGCGSQTTSLPGSSKTGIESKEALFKSAESFFEQKKYDQAVAAYTKYLDHYPQGKMVDTVLLKLGMAHRELNQNEVALTHLNRLIETFPSSPLIVDARIEMLAVYLRQGRFQNIEQDAKDLLAKPLQDTQLLRINSILGDSFVAAGDPVKSVQYYDQMLRLASDNVRLKSFDRVQSAVDLLSFEESEELLKNLPEGGIRDHLLFHLGNLHYSAKNYTGTQAAFKEILEKYGNFKAKDQVAETLKSISSGEIFEPYTFGCLLPLSGSYAAYGERALRGIEMALTHFSQKSPDLIPKLIVKDTQSNFQTAQTELAAMAKEGVAAVIGPMVTAEQVAMTADALGVPILTLTQKDYITDSGPYIFRNFITPEMQVKALVNYAVETLDAKRFAILYPEENYGTTFMDLFWDEVVVHNGMVVGAEPYDKSQTDFADSITKLVGLYYPMSHDERSRALAHVSILRNPEEALQYVDLGFNGYYFPDDDEPTEVSKTDELEKAIEADEADKSDESESIIDFNAVFIPDSPKKVGLIIPQLVYYDIRKVYLLGTNIWHSNNLIRMSRKYLKNAVIVDGFFADSRELKIEKFVSSYQDTYDEKPEIIAASAYDTTRIILDLLSDPRIERRTQVKDHLLTMPPYNGVTGRTTFRPNGDASKDLFILGIRSGSFVELGRLNPYPSDIENNIGQIEQNDMPSMENNGENTIPE